ncbi:MAG: hypothetical protein ACKVP0_26535 [Pirellulaceae bacterium]
MSQDIAKEKARLSQSTFFTQMSRELPLYDLLTVYLKDDSDDRRRGVFCALIPNAKVEHSLERPEWDLWIGSGGPGAMQYGFGEGSQTEYLRYGNDEGIEPLILWRNFDGLRDTYVEISEEFRLFHRLFHDRKSDRFYKFDDAGNEQLVAVIESCAVRIRLLEIRQFLAVREMHLAIFFDSVESSIVGLEDMGQGEGGADRNEGLVTFGLHYGDYLGLNHKKSFSRLLGKRLIPPLSKEKSGFWGFAAEEPEKCVDFIFSVDEHGKEVLSTSAEKELSNYFGANPGRPHYLTPVFFRKGVLDKYYQQPGKYAVEPGYLRCAGLWGMSLDNHLDDHVVAWLGDLGRDLPYQEQLHWRSFNIAPTGKMSGTFFRQQILAEWAETDRPEHLFKYEYGSLLKDSTQALGWPILLALSKEDEHYLAALRIPASEEQRDFDEVILALTKVLVDSLNEKELNKLVDPAELEGLKGSISRLEKACANRGVADYAEHIRFLRDLQDLRSSGAAHRKGSNYQKIAEKMGFDAQSLRDVFRGLLVKGLSFVRFLKSLADGGAFRVAKA